MDVGCTACSSESCIPARPSPLVPPCLQDVLFYQLPEHAQFYPEILNLLEEQGGEGAGAEHATVSVLFGRADALRLERVVGSARSGKMLRSSTTAFLFC
jgi:U3 small nucleolar RNA-associated protein 25